MTMKRILLMVLALAVGLSLCACESYEITTTAAETQTTSAAAQDVLTDEQVVGIWEWQDYEERGPLNGVMHMELYEGGTGKGTNNLLKGDSYYPIVWEIKGEVINISASNAPIVGLKLNKGKLVAVDGSCSYLT